MFGCKYDGWEVMHQIKSPTTERKTESVSEWVSEEVTYRDSAFPIIATLTINCIF
jgi:hypothetical protein